MNKDYLKPCCYCLISADCEARKKFLAMAKSIKNESVSAYVIAMNMSCKKYLRQFKPGDRVSFFYVVGVYGPDGTKEWAEIEGTVIRWKSRALIIWLDEEGVHERLKTKNFRAVRMYPTVPNEELSHQYIESLDENVGEERLKVLKGEMEDWYYGRDRRAEK